MHSRNSAAALTTFLWLDIFMNFTKKLERISRCCWLAVSFVAMIIHCSIPYVRQMFCSIERDAMTRSYFECILVGWKEESERGITIEASDTDFSLEYEIDILTPSSHSIYFLATCNQLCCLVSLRGSFLNCFFFLVFFCQRSIVKMRKTCFGLWKLQFELREKRNEVRKRRNITNHE